MKVTVNLQDVSNQLTKNYGDKGSCVLGYELKLDGIQVVSQPAQGSSTCDYVYCVLKAIMIASGIDADRITIAYGSMD
tara:strand:- start:1013 stop:1246 length:234 start_codon:yes stop_codon:yes gene_type:complete